MGGIALALAIAQIFNQVTPGIAEIILLVKKQDGSIAVMPMLDQADSAFDANLKQASEWLKAHSGKAK